MNLSWYIGWIPAVAYRMSWVLASFRMVLQDSASVEIWMMWVSPADLAFWMRSSRGVLQRYRWAWVSIMKAV